MLIYNYKKEFLGIGEEDLKNLGLKDLEELKREASDFADLFVKTPGHIHNFQHVHWIDFITCAGSSEESKVIISVNNKNYRAVITINKAFLVDSPSSAAYLVNLNKLRELSAQDTQDISADITNKPAPTNTLSTVDTFDSMQPTVEHFSPPLEIESELLASDPYETPLEIEIEEETLHFKETLEVIPETIEVVSQSMEDNLDIGDLSLDLEDDLSIEDSMSDTTQEVFDNGYVYNPSIASDDLGLPLELIEEFIEDFISQAKEFKADLYASFHEHNYDNLKILSHKLKGVAANLRIDDAFEALSLINSSNEAPVIEKNLENFYNIITKLSGETITVAAPTKVVKETPSEPVMEDEDEFIIDFKDDDNIYNDPVEVTKPEPVIEMAEPEPAITESGYSKVSAANEIGLDQESFDELFDDYINESKNIIQNIQEAIKNDDYATSHHEAMKLRGMGDNMRIESLNKELTIIINSSDNEVIQEAIDRIDAIITQISKVEV